MIFNKILNFFSPTSSFVVDEFDHDRNVVVLADKSIGLRVDIKLDGGRKFKSAKIVAPYDVLVEYEDGMTKRLRFLE